jgi:Plant transposon protein
LNNLNILNLSPWIASCIGANFDELEGSVVPFQIHKEEFYKMYVLVDALFVQGFKSPAGQKQKQKKCTAWQEAYRKDIQQAFAFLQETWQCTSLPMHQIELKKVGSRMAACLIHRNMCVSNGVMGDVIPAYDPALSVVMDEWVIENPNIPEASSHK